MGNMDYLKDIPENERESVKQRFERANDPRTSPYVLKELRKDYHWFVREAVARNHGTPEGCIWDLSYDPDSRVREEAAKSLERLGLRSIGKKAPLMAQIKAAENKKDNGIGMNDGKKKEIEKER